MTFKSMKDSGLTFPFRNERESYLAAQALDRLGQVDLVFKNLAFDKNQDQSLDEAYYSSNDRRALRFSDEGLQLPRQKILPYGSLFKNGEKQRNEPNANWAMWSRVLSSGPITGLNASKGFEADFSDWLGETVFPWVEAIPQQSEFSFVSSRNLYDEFYETQAYSLAEKRALAFYIIKNLIGIVVPDPERVNVADPEVSRAAGLFTGFIGQEFFLKRNQSWSGSQAILPLETFAGGNFSEMGMNLLPSSLQGFEQHLEDVEGKILNRGATSVLEMAELNSTVRSLFGLNLMTVKAPGGQTRRLQRYFQPVIGLGGSCWDTPGSSHPCPLEFPVKGSVEATWPEYKEMVTDVFRGTFCLAFDREKFGASFIEALASELELSPEFCDSLLVDSILTTHAFANEYPTDVVQSIILDLVTAGRLINLKPGLASLPLKLGAGKEDKSHGGFRLEMATLLDRTVIFSNSQAAVDHKRQLNYQNFWKGNPGLINGALNYFAWLVGPEKVRDKFREIGVLHMAPDGNFSDLLSLIEATQIKHSRNDASALTFMIDVVNQLLADEALFDSIMRLLVYPTDMEIGDILGYELGLGLNDLYKEDGVNNFDWENLGNNFFKSAIRRENFQTILTFLRYQQPSDLQAFATICKRSIDAVGGLDGQIAVIDAFLGFLIEYFMAYHPDQAVFVSQNFNVFLQGITKIDMPSTYWPSFHRFVTWLNHDGVDFKNQPAPALIRSANDLVGASLDNGPEMIKAYQYNPTDLQRQPDFLKNLIIDFFAPFGNAISANYLLGIIKDTIGITGSNYLGVLLHDRTYRQKVIDLIHYAGMVPGAVWTKALYKMQGLSPEAKNIMRWSSGKIVWSPQASSSSKFFMARFGSIMKPENDFLDKQLQLLESWISGNKKRSYGGVL
ncbi:MAG: hypothetical protein CMP10_07275 [Zetaproteobacteria bacterium]|nr:hypothetical protein [Pseudobdellovibrionaceae bacterium]